MLLAEHKKKEAANNDKAPAELAAQAPSVSATASSSSSSAAAHPKPAHSSSKREASVSLSSDDGDLDPEIEQLTDSQLKAKVDAIMEESDDET